MVYSIALYVSLAVFSLGLLYRLSNWFRFQGEHDVPKRPVLKRLWAAGKGMASTLFSFRLFILLRIFILDVLLQKYFMKAGKLRWFDHICIYLGFILLLFMHAMDSLISEFLFDNYYPTLNPFLFLRNFFGLVVLFGLGVAIGRRIFSSPSRFKSTAMDYYALAILAVIMISGILLESTEILSKTVYQEMVAD